MKLSKGKKNNFQQLMRLWAVTLKDAVAEINAREIPVYISHDILLRASLKASVSESGKVVRHFEQISDSFGNDRKKYINGTSKDWLLVNANGEEDCSEFNVRIIGSNDDLVYVEIQYTEERVKILNNHVGEVVVLNSDGSKIGSYGLVDPQYLYVYGKDIQVGSESQLESSKSECPVSALKLIGIMMNDIVNSNKKPSLMNGDKPHLENFKNHILELAKSQGIDSRGLSKVHDGSAKNGYLSHAIKVLEDSKK